jgi:hypothetical protein
MMRPLRLRLIDGRHFGRTFFVVVRRFENWRADKRAPAPQPVSQAGP